MLLKHSAALSTAGLLRQNVAVITEDLRKCYDSLHLGATFATAGLLGADERLFVLFAQFYRQSRRVFSLRGYTSATWHQVRHGLVQGCPFSVVLLAYMMSGWACRLRAFGVCGAVYIDDRSWWQQWSAATSWRPMIHAFEMTRAFDRGYGLTVNVSKCVLGFAFHCDDILADSAYRIVDEFITLLGIRLHLKDPTRNQQKRYDLDLMKRRLRCIQLVTRCGDWRRPLAASLVLTKITWGAVPAALPAGDVGALRLLILRAALCKWPCTAAHVLFWHMVGWHFDPQVAIDDRLRIWIHFLRERQAYPRWYEHVAVSSTCGRLDHILPQLAPVARRLGWQVAWDDGRVTFSNGDVWRVGWHSFAILRQRVEDHASLIMFRASRGFVTGYRPRQAMATGLDLPPPASGRRLATRTHEL